MSAGPGHHVWPSTVVGEGSKPAFYIHVVASGARRVAWVLATAGACVLAYKQDGQQQES